MGKTVVQLLIFFALVACTAFFGAAFTPDQWYAQLAKPTWTPPGWIFGPVWTLLYIMIAIAGWLTYRADPKVVLSAALVVWLAQLVLNGLWSWLFFGLHRPDLALIDIVLLLACIVAFIALSWSPSRTAALLFIPYALWVMFATALNFQIMRMNT